MSNPVLNSNPYFKERMSAPNTSANFQQYARGGEQPGQAYGQAQYGQQAYAGQQYPQQNAYPQPFDQAQPAYQAGFSAPVAERAMTWDDALGKTALLLGITIATGVATMAFMPFTPLTLTLTLVAAFVVIGLAFYASFKPQISPGLAIAYTVLEGFLLGAATKSADMYYPGIAFQAILGTMLVVGVAVALYRSGKVRTSSKGMKVALTVMVAGIVYGIVNMLVVATGIGRTYFSQLAGGEYGVDAVQVGGLKLGIVLGLIMIVVAGYMLINDLETAQHAVENGAPKHFDWTVAFAIVTTVIWIYAEVLRVLRLVAAVANNN